MYRRVVFVGLGGSGGKTLRFIKRDLRHWLTEHNWPESRDIPEGFQFLHIDSPTEQDGRAMSGAEMLPSKEYLGLVGAGTNFTNVATQLNNRIGIQEEFAGWRVPPPLGVPITAGCGAFRAVGRTVALAYMDEIRTGVNALLDRVTSNRSNSELTELWRLVYNETPTGQSLDPLVIVVSSLAGGTGAGLLMDVFDVIRSLVPWGDNSFGILYTPDVFASIGGGLMNGVQPNSLAAISEILNGHYWHGVQQGNNVQNQPTEIGLKQPKTLQVAGVDGAIGRSGPAYPFLVGTTNAGGVTLSSDKEVFETIGAALVAWCVDPVAQDQLIAFAFANWSAKANENLSQSDLLINRGLPEEQGTPAFNAMGCSRVSVGTRYLERYSSQRLARDAATYIAAYHMESDEARGLIAALNTNRPQEIAVAIAESKFLWFIKEAGLNERGPDANDVLNDLRPAEYGGLVDQAVSTSSQMADIGKGSAQAYLEAVVNAVRNSLVTFDESIRPLIERNVKSWTENKPSQVISVVEQSIASYGFAVTVELLQMVINYLTNPIDGICTELMGENEHKAYSAYAAENEWSAQAAAVLAGVRGNFTMQSNEKVGEAIVSAVNYGHNIAEAQIREHASFMLSEFSKGFLAPLKRYVADASIVLERDLDGISSWPNWSDGLPPSDSTPPSSEFTLIEPEDFGKVFIETLSKTIGGDPTRKEEQRAAARLSVISGDFLREMEVEANLNRNLVRPAQAIQISQSWNPGSAVVRDSRSPKADLVVELKFSPADLQQRARMWLRRSNTAFDDLLKSTLRTYTAGNTVFGANIHVDESEYRVRRTKFITQLRRAIDSSAPLVELDSALHQHIHPVRPFKVQFSSFPFNGHELESEIIDTLRPLVSDNGQVIDSEIARKYLVNDGSIESVQLMSFLNGAHYPFLFSSLLEPIGQRWGRDNATPHERGQFWTKRRARLLGEFVPAPQEHIIALIRGWFTGRLLGLIDVPRNGENRPIRIAQPFSLESGAVNFPHPLLTTPTCAGDELFAVLEALSLAYVMVGQQNNLSPLRPYIVLRDMGTMMLDERILRYDQPNPLIISWIKDGKLSSQFGNRTKEESALRDGLQSEMNVELLERAGSDFSPEDRKGAFLKLLDDVTRQYSSDAESYWDSVALNRSSLNSPPYWPSIRTTSETPDILMRALESLVSAIGKVQTSRITGV
jgi:hypothetical protein